MKQVDSIVQSFDIQDDEIEFERDEEGNDLVLGHGAYGQVRLLPAPFGVALTLCFTLLCSQHAVQPAALGPDPLSSRNKHLPQGGPVFSGLQGAEGRRAGRGSEGAV